MKNLFLQIVRFGIVGIIATAIDYGLMVILKEVVGISYLTSCAVSFTVSCVINYFLSIKFVFASNEKMSKPLELSVFCLLSLIGLGLNQVIMWYTVENLKINYLIGKIVATAIVMAYNFISRKFFFKK